MRKTIAILVLALAAAGAVAQASRTCEEHDGWTAPTGYKIGTTQDQGRDAVDVCSDDGRPVDGTVRAGARRGEGEFVAVDGDTDGADHYAYVTRGRDGRVHAYCGTEGEYDTPGGKTADSADRDEGRTDSCI